MGLAVSICEHVLYGALEFALYMLVDVVAKTSLREAGTDEEKRLIWLYESVAIFILSAVIYLFHHVPYMLATLACTTFLYTQLLGRVDFSYWWHLLVTKWDEFEQHEQSLEQRQQPPEMSMASMPVMTTMGSMPAMTAGMVSMPHMMPGMQASQQWMMPPVMTQLAPPSGMMPQSMLSFDARPEPTQQYEAWYPADSERVQMQQRGASISSSTPTVAAGDVRLVGRTTAPMMAINQPHNTYVPTPVPPGFRFAPYMPRTSELIRRPIHLTPGASITVSDSADTSSISSRLKARVMSVLGMQSLTTTQPRGLINDRQNLCFMNSVLQCLLRSPGLVGALPQEAATGMQENSLLRSIVELMHKLNVTSGTASNVDASALCRAASVLPGSMVASPSRPQAQQDAAEFLMWLLSMLHGSLNTGGRGETGHQGASFLDANQQVMSKPRMALNMLKFIYGGLTPQRIGELKAQCRKEIEQANGLDNDSYAEPIQRLSDLEWLTYKESNNSVIDDLFTGQMVEAQHCIACNRISVSIQTFSILPVSVVEPRLLNGLVYLEDCFTKFGNIEDLFGANGLRCEACNQRQKTMSPCGGSSSMPHIASGIVSPILVNGTVGKTLRRRGGGGLTVPSDSAIVLPCVMSPIASASSQFNDSGFHDNQFRTSTPIHSISSAAVRTPPSDAPVRLTDGQRRSLLRQLPECLVVQLMRFSYHNGEPRKLLRPVSIPLHNLNLTHLIIDNVLKRDGLTAISSSYRYDLYGVSVHLGSSSISFGHYVAYVIAGDGKWYRFDDDQVTSVNMEYELNTKRLRENAYMLFYRKCSV